MRYTAIRKDGMRLIASEHSVERWQERVRPALDFEAARRDLIRTAQTCGTVSQHPPHWAPFARSGPQQRFMLLGDDIVLVCEPTTGTSTYVITTVLVRAGLTESQKERRKRQRQKKAARRKARGKSRDRRERKRIDG